MKVKITTRGVYDAKGKAIEPGTTITVKGDAVPAWLVNKCEIIADGRKADAAVTNPASGAAQQDT